MTVSNRKFATYFVFIFVVCFIVSGALLKLGERGSCAKEKKVVVEKSRGAKDIVSKSKPKCDDRRSLIISVSAPWSYIICSNSTQNWDWLKLNDAWSKVNGDWEHNGRIDFFVITDKDYQTVHAKCQCLGYLYAQPATRQIFSSGWYLFGVRTKEAAAVCMPGIVKNGRRLESSPCDIV